MWKTEVNVVGNRIIFHNPCGNRCGNLRAFVEKNHEARVFHISTGPFLSLPVEMWKTFSQLFDFKQLMGYWRCGKLSAPNRANYLQRLSIMSLTILWKF